MGLAFSDAIAVHIRDAKEGKLVEPSDANQEELKIYELLMAADTDEDLLIPTAPSTSTNLPADITAYRARISLFRRDKLFLQSLFRLTR